MFLYDEENTIYVCFVPLFGYLHSFWGVILFKDRGVVALKAEVSHPSVYLHGPCVSVDWAGMLSIVSPLQHSCDLTWESPWGEGVCVNVWYACTIVAFFRKDWVCSVRVCV